MPRGRNAAKPVILPEYARRRQLSSNVLDPLSYPDWLQTQGDAQQVGSVVGKIAVGVAVGVVADALAGGSAATEAAVNAAKGSTVVGNAANTTDVLAKYGNSAAKMTHIFDEPTHNLGSLVTKYGSNEAAFAAVDTAAQKLAGQPGVVAEWIDVGGTPVWVRRTAVNGSFRIGTFSGNTANPKHPLPIK